MAAVSFTATHKLVQSKNHPLPIFDHFAVQLVLSHKSKNLSIVLLK